MIDATGTRDMTKEEMEAELERLRQENTEIRNKNGAGHRLKVTEKGGVSLYGCGRFPITLYDTQWQVIITLVEQGIIQGFMRDHWNELSHKDYDKV